MAISYVGGAAANNPTDGTSGSITHGLSIDENDFIVAIVHVNQTGQGITDNNGASAMTERMTDTTTGATSQFAIFDRVAGASEPASYSFTWNNSTHWGIALMVFSGVDTSDPWDIAPSATYLTTDAGPVSTETFASASTTVDNCYAVAFGGSDNLSVTGFSIDNSFNNTDEVLELEKPTVMYYKSLGGSGAIGTTILTLEGTTADAFTVMSALQPGSVGTTINVPTGPWR